MAQAQSIPSLPAHDIYDKVHNFLEWLKTLDSKDIRQEEQAIRPHLEACRRTGRLEQLMAFEYQFVRLGLGLPGMRGLGDDEERQMQCFIAWLKDALDDTLYNRLIQLDWVACETDNMRMCEPGSLVWLILWENMKSGEVSVKHPTRVSTDTGTWIKKKYLAIIHHKTGEGFAFFIITSKGDTGIVSALEVDPTMYVRIFKLGVPFPPNLRGEKYAPLKIRYMPFKKSLLWPTGAQLPYDYRNSLFKITKKAWDPLFEQMHNATELRNIPKNTNKWKGEPKLTSSKIFGFGDVPKSLLTPPVQTTQIPAHQGSGGFDEETRRLEEQVALHAATTTATPRPEAATLSASPSSANKSTTPTGGQSGAPYGRASSDSNRDATRGSHVAQAMSGKRQRTPEAEAERPRARKVAKTDEHVDTPVSGGSEGEVDEFVENKSFLTTNFEAASFEDRAPEDESDEVNAAKADAADAFHESDDAERGAEDDKGFDVNDELF